MKRWERWVTWLLVLAAVGSLLCLAEYEPEVAEGSVVTEEGIVADRAMSDGLAYITVIFPDGRTICCWELYRDAPIPEEIIVGDAVRITYGVEQSHGRYALLNAERYAG